MNASTCSIEAIDRAILFGVVCGAFGMAALSIVALWIYLRAAGARP